ncbi:MAG: hypothetical protein Q9221_007772 [Calogaya cf. arnoldii]
MTLTCPPVGDLNQPQILVSAKSRLRLGQISNDPAGLSGRIITNGHPQEVWADFKTGVLPVPAAPTPGWGTYTWQVVNAQPRCHPPMQVRFQSRGPIVDKWYSFFARDFVYQIAGVLQSSPDKEVAAHRLDVTRVTQEVRFRLRPFHPGSKEFTVFDEIAVFDIFLRLLKDHEARDLTISVMIAGVSVAVGYLDLEQPPVATNGANSSKIEHLGPGMDGRRLLLSISPQSNPALDYKLSELRANINITSVERGELNITAVGKQYSLV